MVWMATQAVMPGALTVHAFFQKHIVAVDFNMYCSMTALIQDEVCVFVLSHLLIPTWQRYFKILGLSNIYCCSRKNNMKFLHGQCYKFAGWKVLRYCYVQIGDNSYSKIFPYLWDLWTRGWNIPQSNSCILFIVSPFCLHPDRALPLSLVPVPTYSSYCSQAHCWNKDFILTRSYHNCCHQHNTNL